ncbi:hypothetical protein ABPG75_001802 [Micractinium tetrahymenae]
MQGPVGLPEIRSNNGSSGSSAGSPSLPPASGGSSAAPAALARVQERGGASLLQLVAAWDQLAARLPPQTGAGHGGQLILEALKLAVGYAPPAPTAPAAAVAGDAAPAEAQLSRPAARALSLASRLADLAAVGLPVDAESIAAGILAEVLLAGAHAPGAWHPPGAPAAAAAADSSSSGGGSRSGGLTLQIIEDRVGPIVAQLVHDVQRARQLPARVELLDDTAASALRELCLSFYDVRATTVEIVARLGLLCSPGQPSYEQQVAALEALQMYAPMGHALGLGPVAQQLEDRCFQILFPESYVRTAAWLREEAAANADTLDRCQAALRSAVLRQPRFAELAAGLTVHGRTKTLFSTLKKLLRLGNTAAGGRARAQLYDLMGLRAIVQPRDDLPPEEAEALAAQACYLVRDTACALWECLPHRSKDYIAAPKSNGYQSLHSTVRVRSETVSVRLSGGSPAGAGDACASAEGGGGSGGEEVRSTATLELQIRTQAMHERAERGDAAHGAYKGGLDAAQAVQLKSVTDAMLRRAAAAAAAAAASPGQPAVATAGGSASADAAADSLFRHLDQNGDGRISLEELQFALQELGVREAQAQSRAAAELLQLACADDGGASGDGTIGYEAFMAFQRRVGLLQAISAVDHQQAHVLEEQHAAAAEAAQHPGSSGGAQAGAAGGSVDEGSLFCDPPSAAGLAWASGSFDGGDSSAGGSGSRLAARALACRAQSSSASPSSGAALRWQPPGHPAGHCRGALLVRATPVETASSSSSSISSSDSADSDSEAQPEASSRTGATHVCSGVRNSAVAMRVGSSNGAASNNGSSSSSGSGSGGAEDQSLLQKPERRAPPERGELPLAAAEELPADADAPSQRDAAAVWRASRAVQGIVRLVSGSGPPPADATWQLVAAPCNPHRVLNAAGDALPAAAAGIEQCSQVLRVPEEGPCIIGAVLDRDCDYVLDVPTVSGRHARLEALRRPDARGGYSRLLLIDLGSTNGTRVNRRLIAPFKEVPLRPGDIVSLAEDDIAFEVLVVPPPPPAATTAASNGSTASAAAAAGAAGADLAPSPVDAAAADQQAAAALPPVVAALRLASALEALAAAQGLFPPGGAVYADVSDRARQLLAAGSFDQAYVLLLAGAMQQPWAGALWAQLANLERQRARQRQRSSSSASQASALGGSFATARAFFAAAAACFAALTPAWVGGALRAAAERAEGLTRVYTSWGQLELQQRNVGAARTLLRRGVGAAREHPAGAAAAGAPRLLVTWATKEWRSGELVEAQRLCVEALEIEPGNAYALTLLGSIEAAGGQADVARRLFERAVEADPQHTAALHAWARLETSSGNLSRARSLFRRALELEPNSAFVLQAWGVAEARRGSKRQARSLLQRATEADPGCRAAWHAWGKLEDDVGSTEAARQLYQRVLELAPGSVPTLSALGCLERRAGDLAAAERHLSAALAAEPSHLPSLYELAVVREAQGRAGEAAALRRSAARLASGRRQALQEAAAGRLPPGMDAQ